MSIYIPDNTQQLTNNQKVCSLSLFLSSCALPPSLSPPFFFFFYTQTQTSSVFALENYFASFCISNHLTNSKITTIRFTMQKTRAQKQKQRQKQRQKQF
ncbi:hypothetical protein J3Q64DRAFT_1151171 [Phycomyces blakesleeanus]|uniref:Homeodomain-like DNA binding domain-containing transcription factor n=1 Tax=Phycomyces blakesleeanus TaxID=4837 RepID=A0ABR3AUS1_PHYBL